MFNRCRMKQQLDTRGSSENCLGGRNRDQIKHAFCPFSPLVRQLQAICVRLRSVSISGMFAANCMCFNVFPREMKCCLTLIMMAGLVISDASWGLSDLERRRSTSGGLVLWQGSLVKGYSRLQGCVTLSSCEDEIITVCQLTQECLGIRHVTEFLESFGNKNMLSKMSTKEFLDLSFDDLGQIGERYPILIFSDSQSCLGALSNQGLSRRVRRVSIAVCYIHSVTEEHRKSCVRMDARCKMHS